jgi:hypothetical protein
LRCESRISVSPACASFVCDVQLTMTDISPIGNEEGLERPNWRFLARRQTVAIRETGGE